MSNRIFWQCSIQACRRSCNFEFEEISYTPGQYGSSGGMIVALYLVQKSQGNEAKVAEVKNDRSGGCAGVLC
jgi:hypothetical protein